MDNGLAWDGHGGFAAWLVANVPEAGFSSRPSPGYGWDPNRFSEADLRVGEHVELRPLQRQVATVTDIPLAQHRAVRDVG